MLYAAALHNIFAAMKGLRIFDRFGFDRPKSKTEAIPAKVTNDYQEWVFMAKYHDWVSTDSEHVLSSYYPEDGLIDLLANSIDTVSE